MPRVWFTVRRLMFAVAVVAVVIAALRSRWIVCRSRADHYGRKEIEINGFIWMTTARNGSRYWKVSGKGPAELRREAKLNGHMQDACERAVWRPWLPVPPDPPGPE